MKLVAFAAVALAAASPAFAQTQVSAASVTASNTFSLFGQYRPENLINGSGLTGGLHNDDFTAMWLTDLGVQRATLVFDLGSVLDLTSIDIWQYNFGNPAQFASTILSGVKDFTVLTSLDGVTFDTAFTDVLALGTGQPLAAQSFALSTSARFVRIDTLTNYFQGTFNERDSAIGLSEVRFGAVPEPATWAMMIGGFALVGGALRRRTLATA